MGTVPKRTSGGSRSCQVYTIHVSLTLAYVKILHHFSSCVIITPPSFSSSSEATLPGAVLPHVILWSPLVQLQHVLSDSHQCPHEQCLATITSNEHGWNIGCSAGTCPRLIHDVDYMIILVPAVYTCQCGHVTLGTDPRILARIAEQEFIPFILFPLHWCDERFCKNSNFPCY